jgi:hypothetical protein
LFILAIIKISKSFYVRELYSHRRSNHPGNSQVHGT